MHYTTSNPNRLILWPACLLLAVALAACTQTTNIPETAEPETVPTDPSPTPTKPPPTEEIPTATAQPTPTDTAVPLPTAAANTNLDEPFTLGGGEETLVGPEEIKFVFDSVLEDSRCPTQVDCFWSGQARILIIVMKDQEEPILLEFNTNPAPDETVDELPIYDYTVRLIQLDPYPQTTDPIPFADYQAQLVVTLRE